MHDMHQLARRQPALPAPSKERVISEIRNALSSWGTLNALHVKVTELHKSSTSRQDNVQVSGVLDGALVLVSAAVYTTAAAERTSDTATIWLTKHDTDQAWMTEPSVEFLIPARVARISNVDSDGGFVTTTDGEVIFFKVEALQATLKHYY